MKPKFKKIMLKLSGEGLANENQGGIDAKAVNRLALEIKSVVDLGVKVCMVIGGGNFFRGVKNAVGKMDRSVADQIGMLATAMNALVMKSALEECGCEAQVFSGLSMPMVCETYTFNNASEALNLGKVVIFAGGTGNPYFTTDTGAVLRALEMHCEVVMKATQVDGVYDCDPRSNANANRYDEISYNEVLEKHLNVMDMSAIALARDNQMPLMVFAQKGENAILNALCAINKHTIIK